MGRSSSSTRNQATSASPPAADRGSHGGSAARSGLLGCDGGFAPGGETNDLCTRGRRQRVSWGAVMIGPGDRHAGQRGAGDPYAGMLHDAGKLRVPTTVLRKEEPAWRPVPADEEVPQRASYRHQPQGDPGTHEPDQDRRRPGARAELYSGNTQHAPNMELPPKPRKDNYQRPERRFYAPWRQPALITERHAVPGRGHAGLDRPGWGEQVDDMPRAFMHRRGPAGPPRWQRSECPAALAGCRVRVWPAMQEETGFGWREQEPVEDRPSASCTKERQPCLAVARCGFGKAMVSFSHCGEPFRACVRRGGGGRLCCLRMAKPVGRWT